jgi:hypothetical protein
MLFGEVPAPDGRVAAAARRRQDLLTKPQGALGRLERFRCFMVQRGIGAGPLRPASDYVNCEVPGSSRRPRPS